MSEDDETIVATGNVRVRVMKLAPGEATDWHFHTEVTDTFFCLSGRIVVRMPAAETALSPGERETVPPGKVHRVENRHRVKARYLLIQGVGKYDFVAAPEPEAG
jgi:mannose-6-phosphate isomerase-like protein (cupin superfamily)